MSPGKRISAIVLLAALGCAQAVAGSANCPRNPAADTQESMCNAEGLKIPSSLDPSALALFAHHASGIFAQSWADERLRHAPYWLAIADASAVADPTEACPAPERVDPPVIATGDAPLNPDAAAMLTTLTALHRFSRLSLQR